MTGDPQHGKSRNLLKATLSVAVCIMVVLLIVVQHNENAAWLSPTHYISAPQSENFILNFNASGVIVSKDTCNCHYLYRNVTNHNNKTRHADVLFQGRLGNLMFQYAALYCVSRTNGLIPRIYEKAELTEYFGQLDSEIFPDKETGKGFKGFVEVNSMMYDNRTLRFFESDVNRHLFGFYQSWKYCHPYRKEIKEQFTFVPSIESKADAFLKSLHDIYSSSDIAINGELTYIGLHIRRGDFIRGDKQPLGYMSVDDNYIRKAMRHFTKQFPNAIYVVCSDDTSWAKGHVKSEAGNEPVVFSPFREAEVDMCIMSKCNHTVMSTGTFGWWAAWLADGQVVYPKEYPHADSWLGKQCRREDYYMSHWTGL